MGISVKTDLTRGTNAKDFPKLMKHNSSQLIILVDGIAPDWVTVVHGGNGYTTGTVIEGINLNSFSDYNEPLTLQNT